MAATENTITALEGIDRMRQAHSIEAALRLNDPPRLDALPQIPPVQAGQPFQVQTPNENQVALDAIISRVEHLLTP